jgi:hypothetical protein
MASVDMAPYCTRCHARHFPDSRHYGRVRLTLRRILRRR